MAAAPLAEMNLGEGVLATKAKGKGDNKKRLSVERIYQRKTQLEHVLLRPDTYIGSVEETTENMWVFDEEKEAIVRRPTTYVPGLYKIFDEILVNAADNKQRDPSMNTIKIIIDPEDNLISIWNNGRGIPVEIHATEKMYVPELIFGTLLTSSNYDDDQKKVTGGRNGYGAKLCNIFSTEFTIETACSDSGKVFKQTWKNNMGVSGKASINASKQDYTKVTFKPDLAKFKMTHLDRDTVALMTRRAYDIAGCTKGVAIYLNGKKLAVKTFKSYVELYLRGQSSEEEEEIPRKVIHEVVNPRWEVAVTASNSGFQQASFVNSIATTKGGTHVNYVVDQVVSKLLEAAKKKNKGGMDLKPFHIKGHLWVFVNCLIENPTFDSQTKENMTLKVKSFGSTCVLNEKFIKQALTCGVVERVLSWARVKSQVQLAKKQQGSKHSKLRGIPKLDDANEAGGKNSLECTLIVTEGDSAKTLAVSGLGVVGRDYYGAFPLRGKLLNVREASHNQLMGNEEISNMVKILGLQYAKKYSDPAEMKSLRYGRLMIMADQDQDGSHIKGLVINFIHHNWPNLLKHNFVEEFITPIVKVSKGRQEHAFFSLPEFETWRTETENSHTWKVKYYKGLGTSTSKEAKEYFSDMDRHRIPFKYTGPEDDDAILLAFSKKQVEKRKEWLTNWLQHRRERRMEGLNESFLYRESTDFITYSDFINKELILFSNMDNERSIPSMVDGLKPGQRKVLYTCFKRNDKKDIKVAQLAGSVAEHSAYHHGETSLMSTIINLAQNFVGSNNINLLQPIGQFGTRLNGGKDAASPRYIFTMLSPLSRLIFPPSDDHQLSFTYEDNMRIEPEWYCPILPMVLVNGSDGIGTGYSTSVPNYDPREIVANLKRMMNGMEPTEMKPWYKNFTGEVAHVEPHKYIVYGRIARLSPTSLEITELPIRSWTQTYKENVLEPMLHGTEKVQPFITDYKEYHTDSTVRFVVSLSQEKMHEAEKVGFHKKFKLESSINTSNMVLFDHNGCLKKYSGVTEILQEFYEVRLDIYRKRKEWLEGQLEAESAKLDNQARFIMEKIEGKVVIENKRKVEMIEQLKSRGYASDPVKAWKESISEREDDEEGSENGEESASTTDADYNYLLSMQLWSLTKEKKEELLKNRDKKAEELRILREKTPKDLWKEDMDAFMEKLDQVEQLELQEEVAGAMITVKKKKGKGKTTGRQTKLTSCAGSSSNSLKVTRPSPFAEEIEPIVPEFNAEPKKASSSRGKGKIKAEKDSKEGIKTGKSPEKLAAAKAVKDAFGLSDDETPPPSLYERLKVKSSKQSVLKLEKVPKKAVVESEPSDLEDDDAFMEIDTPPLKAKKTIGKNQPKDVASKKPGVKAGKKRPQKTLEDFLDSDDDDIPVLKKVAVEKKAVSKPKAQPAAKPTAKSTKPAPKKPNPKTISISSDDSEEEEIMSKEQLGPDPSDRAMRVRSKPVKYIASDEEESEIELTSESDEEFDIPMPKKAVSKTSSKPAAKPTKLVSKKPNSAPRQTIGTSSDESEDKEVMRKEQSSPSHAVRVQSKTVKYTVSDEEMESVSESDDTPVPKKAVAKPAAAKPTSKPASRPASKPTAKPASKPTAKPASKPTAKPASKPAAKPTKNPAAKKVVSISSDESEEEEEVVKKPVSKTSTKPAAKSAKSIPSKQQSGSDSGGRAMRVRSKPVKYVISDEESGSSDWQQISDGSDSDFN